MALSRRLLGPGLLVLLSLILFTCSQDGSTTSKETTLTAAEAAERLFHPLATHFAERYTDDLPGLLKRKYIRVLVTFNRTNFFFNGERLFGFEYAMLRDYEKFLNRKIRRRDLRVVLDFIPVSRDRLLPALREGYGDIAAAGLTITPEREKTVNFSRPYLTVDEVVVTNGKVKGVESAEDLAGREVMVRQSSSYYESLMKLNDELREKGLEPVKVIKADETLETEDILEMVNSGAVEITVSDSDIARVWARVLHGIRVHEDLTLREGGKIAWAVRKGNPELRASINRFMKKRRKGTLVGNIYFQRYFENTKWIENPLTRTDEARLARLRKLFKKYASEYGFDWKLVMAVAYQESKLNNRKRSSAGAVGIMQVRPATAADRNIAVGDVSKLENNIHAGVKYLAFLRDHYYSEADVAERDRVRFTLAAYNAGPGKIRKARALAARIGLDPNKWFRNVEIAALKVVGQEPVRYVSNINKFYVIFSLALARQNAGKGDVADARLTLPGTL
jgi:membrane-bound lytic murein transglycosylase MltF